MLADLHSFYADPGRQNIEALAPTILLELILYMQNSISSTFLKRLQASPKKMIWLRLRNTAYKK
jgi:hypothetical protein